METGVLLMVVAGAAFVLPLVGERYRIPSVVLEILFGVLVGPSVSNLIPSTDILSVLASFGFFLLLFLAGFEIDFDELRGESATLVGLGFAAFVGTLVLAFGAALLLDQGLFVAMMLATTSVGVVLPTLKGSRQEATRMGRAILAAAIIADFLTLIGAAVYAVIYEAGLSTELLGAPLLFGASALAYVVLRRTRNATPGRLQRWVTHDDPKELGVRAAFAAMFGFAGLAELLGVEPILGAFLAGIVFSMALPHPEVLRKKMAGLAYGFLIPIFFIDVGIRFRLEVLGSSDVLTTVGVLFVAALVVKIVPSLAFLTGGFSARESLSIGVLLSARLSLIIAMAELGVELGIVSAEIEGATIVLALVTTTLAPIVFERLVHAPPRLAAPEQGSIDA